MLNKEKYAKEILDIVCNGNDVGKRNGHLYPCVANVKCPDCEFYKSDTSCNEEFAKWANSEYKEPEIDWNKVPVDTPVYVWNNNYKEKIQRHFANFKDNIIRAFDNGKTSWTECNVSYWKHAEIKEGVDCSEWYKD